jgi:hypothetical protein
VLEVAVIALRWLQYSGAVVLLGAPLFLLYSLKGGDGRRRTFALRRGKICRRRMDINCSGRVAASFVFERGERGDMQGVAPPPLAACGSDLSSPPLMTFASVIGVWNDRGMWSLLRILIVSLAFVGFVAQSEARATAIFMTPAEAPAEMKDCPDMGMISADAAPRPQKAPCKELTADCIAKMGCGLVSPVLAISPSIDRPAPTLSLAYRSVSHPLAGLLPSPPRDPPKS